MGCHFLANLQDENKDAFQHVMLVDSEAVTKDALQASWAGQKKRSLTRSYLQANITSANSMSLGRGSASNVRTSLLIERIISLLNGQEKSTHRQDSERCCDECCDYLLTAR